jgi:trk system potassium uptake protein TrkA
MVVQNSRHAILVGGGRVGYRTAGQLNKNGYTVTIIERDDKKQDEIAKYPGCRVVVGDGTDVDVFQQANPTTADVVAGLTDDTETNLMVCELAREIVSGVRTLVRINSDGEQDYAYLDYVDSVVYPAAAGAAVATSQITGTQTNRLSAADIR